MRLPLLAALLVTASLAACSNASSAPSPAAQAQPQPPAPPAALATAHAGAPASPAAAPQGARPRLVFFMNPNGRPCQLQDQVLRAMAAELSPRAELVYYKTTEGADLIRFEQYGIRSLPTLLLTDASGAELRRATPGIQSEAAIRQLLGP
jgi:thioredoxin 1